VVEGGSVEERCLRIGEVEAAMGMQKEASARGMEGDEIIGRGHVVLDARMLLPARRKRQYWTT
jgi:hypothetical protein